MGLVITDLQSISQVKRRRLAVLEEVGVLGRFFARVPRLVADFDAAQPLDPHVTFPARHHQAQADSPVRAATPHRSSQTQRGSRRGPLNSGTERFIPDASAPSGISHLALVLRPASSSNSFREHAGIHDVVHHTVRELAAVELGAAPFHAGVCSALEEEHLVDYAGSGLQVVHCEDQWLVDKAVDHQTVLRLDRPRRCRRDGAQSTARSGVMMPSSSHATA